MEIVGGQLCQLNVHKSMGTGGIHSVELNALVDVMAGPLSLIHQRSWEPEEDPTVWKLDNIFPTYKKGMKEDPGNYYPSLTSVSGKMMEKILLDSIESILDTLSNCEMIRCTLHWMKNWPFDMRKNFFSKKIVKHWNKVLRSEHSIHVCLETSATVPEALMTGVKHQCRAQD
ncbi:rna-directed dna polymerase from mobile element hypothetical protein [Limosa lapponica baueri]|uniref:Rna-directed dna polymerase from mobile element jockey-like n=1 Tax=Limosa lapponica baueri TaxID=1758121 RepID=A0A2I0U8Q5_LIMLA|nr:rna-directed dna polymerase from mobile element hypothetical protein [Limosa lapponica baueri]